MEDSDPPKSIMSTVAAWGNSSLAPTGLATLISAQHLRPFKVLPMMFVPVLLFSSYANLQGFRKDAAGITAAASGTYGLLALRRRHPIPARISARGVVRGVALGIAAANVMACAWVYATVDRDVETRERKDNPRW